MARLLRVRTIRKPLSSNRAPSTISARLQLKLSRHALLAQPRSFLSALARYQTRTITRRGGFISISLNAVVHCEWDETRCRFLHRSLFALSHDLISRYTFGVKGGFDATVIHFSALQ
jgi:hypothetical protein